MLKEYRAKRDFKITSEPAGGAKYRSAALNFVIQEHHASHLHWDFRLECDGVLKSWAVPKGPSTDPNDKRLAVMVEDHPLEYGRFEGTIPKGQYGGGQVIIWDRGTYAPDEPEPEWDDRGKAQQRVRDGLANGKLAFTLRGNRLKGSWALVRLKRDPKNWLLIKHRDAFSDGGRAVEEQPSKDSPVIAPMLAREATEAFDDEAWAFEPKLDGVRAIAYRDDQKVEMVSRGGLQIADRFERIVNAVRGLRQQELVLDGEIVAFDEAGKPDFQRLMTGFHGRTSLDDAVFVVFDLLSKGGASLVASSYEVRRAGLL